MGLLPKYSQISNGHFQSCRTIPADQDFLGKSNSKDLKRSLLLSSGGGGTEIYWNTEVPSMYLVF